MLPAARKELDSKLEPPTAQHFELKYGANHQLKEGRVYDSGPNVCSSSWAFSDSEPYSIKDALHRDVDFNWVCGASFFNRTVDFGDNRPRVAPPRRGARD